VYVIVITPGITPVTTPLPEPTVAYALPLLAHVPPDAALLKVVVPPTHTVVVPVIAGGNGLTVKEVVV
jgi:hypothetical protein